MSLVKNEEIHITYPKYILFAQSKFNYFQTKHIKT